MSDFTPSAEEVDLCDSISIARYGETIQRKLTGFTDEALKNVLERDTSEIGALLQGITQQIQALPLSAVQTRGLFGAFRKLWQQEDLAKRYKEVSRNLERSQKELEGWRMKLLVDLRMLDAMYARLMDYHGELVVCIHAGEKKLEEFRTNELMWLKRRAVATDAETDVLLYNEAETRCESFSNRISDLVLTKTISAQLASQIQLVTEVNRQLTATILSGVCDQIAAWQLNVATGLAGHEDQANLRAYDSQLLDALTEALVAERKGARLKLEMAEGD